jgi:hypothetical protein
MDVGFETIGNATLIVHDERPLLATDPWLSTNAYFGSWTLSHAIPEEQRRAVEACPYIWFSHGHPDHLNAASLGIARGKTVLLCDHVNGRMKSDLEREGFAVKVLEDRQWMRLGERVRVLGIADYNQDGILLVEVNGRLIVNTNDASDRGWSTFVSRTVRGYERSFLLALTNYGDADMMNLHDESGRFLDPPAHERWPLANVIAEKMRVLGTKVFVPFSSLHRYQRADSAWANAYIATLEDYPDAVEGREVLPAFIRYDCANDAWTRISPRENVPRLRAPGEFGDDWSEPLERQDEAAIGDYFRSIEHLSTFLDFVSVRIGGRETTVPLSNGGYRRGITFEAPRGSFMTSIRHQVFDDLLIGNFMKATLHGEWPGSRLYPDFTPWVAKYADNGRAKSRDEVERYFRAYRARAGFDYLRHRIEERSKQTFRASFSDDSHLYRLAKRIYWSVKTA